MISHFLIVNATGILILNSNIQIKLIDSIFFIMIITPPLCLLNIDPILFKSISIVTFIKYVNLDLIKKGAAYNFLVWQPLIFYRINKLP